MNQGQVSKGFFKGFRGFIVSLLLLSAYGSALGHDVIGYLDHSEAQIQRQGELALAELSKPQLHLEQVIERLALARWVVLDVDLIIPAVAREEAPLVAPAGGS